MIRKHSAPAIKVLCENPGSSFHGTHELYVYLGGRWIYIGSDKYMPLAEALKYQSCTTLTNENRHGFSVASIERSAGRKISWKREAFILKWESNLHDTSIPF